MSKKRVVQDETFVEIIKNKIKDKFYDFSIFIHKIFNKNKKEKRSTISKMSRNRRIWFWILVAYPLLQFSVFYVAVNINSILLAFKSFNPENASFYFSGFNNFSKFLNDIRTDPGLITATSNSVKLYLAGLFIGLPLNLLFSFFLYKKIKFAETFKVVLFLPQILSALVVSLMFRYFIEELLTSLIGVNLLQNKSSGFNTLIFFTIWASFGTQILIYTSSMSKIDRTIIESGKIDGMNTWQEFWYIILPSIYPTITIFLVVGVAGLFTSQAGLFSIYGVTARTDLQTLGYVFFVRIFRNTEASIAQYPYAAAAGLLFTAVAAPITFLAKHLLEKYGPSEE